jgi:serine/threonine protein kinase
MVLPVCSGGDLYYLLRTCKRLSEDQAGAIMRPLVSAVSALHQKGILHLDLKPENILFTHNGVLKVADFGFADYLPTIDARLSMSSTRDYPTLHTTERGQFSTNCRNIHGTIGYISPEMLMSDVRTPFADIWSMGVILYVMISGVSPFGARTIQ